MKLLVCMIVFQNDLNLVTSFQIFHCSIYLCVLGGLLENKRTEQTSGVLSFISPDYKWRRGWDRPRPPPEGNSNEQAAAQMEKSI